MPNQGHASYDGASRSLFDFHRSMLFDRVRTESFLRAIVATVQPGDVVVDIGTGSGVLALLAVLAGARTVYAIEREPIIEVAKRIADVNGVLDRIQFVAATSTEVELPERGDVLVTETVGNAGFDEGILTWVADASSRLLKPDARLIPKHLALHGALLELPRHRKDLDLLAHRLYTLDLSPLRELTVNRMFWDEVNPVSIVSSSKQLIAVDLHEIPSTVSGSGEVVARRDASVDAVGVWFESVIADGIALSNAPPGRAPSWHQGVVMLDEAIDVRAGDAVHVEIEVSPDGSAWHYEVDKR